MGKLFNYFEAALAEKKSAFAVYRKPGENIVRGIFGYENAAYPFELDAEGFVFVPFGEGKKVFISAESSVTLAESFETGKRSDGVTAVPQTDANAKADFEALVSKSVNVINDGKFEKLVCSRAETVAIGTTDVVTVFKQILYAYPDAFCYCVFSPESGLWLGATPEQLLKVKDGKLHTVALAGTQLYNENETAVWPEKEKQEQKFVTDYIVNRLGDFVQDINVTAPYTFRAGNIVHIKTDITADMQDSKMLHKVVDVLHPTPAVCGLPKDEAKDFLLDNEGYDREYYAGYLGEAAKGESNLFVNLRCMKIEGNTAKIFVGCGITKDSDPEKEFFETVNKSMTMRRVL